jgi:DNA-binding NarL/FixJ family response regulator
VGPDGGGTVVAYRVFLAGGSSESIEGWCEHLQRAGLEVLRGDSADGALAPARLELIDLAILDARWCESLAFCREPHDARSGRPFKVLCLSSEYDAARVVELSRVSDLVLPLPISGETLLRAIRQLLDRHDDVNRFATRYRLSPKEASLVRHALEGLNNDEAADALGCTRPTVSTYWNRIFRKTGVSGQRDLVILVMRGAHAMPVIKTARDASHARR